MGEAEAHDGRLAVFVAGSDVVVIVVGVRADLNAAEGHLGAGIDISEPVSPHERIHPVNQPLLRLAGFGRFRLRPTLKLSPTAYAEDPSCQ